MHYAEEYEKRAIEAEKFLTKLYGNAPDSHKVSIVTLQNAISGAGEGGGKNVSASYAVVPVKDVSQFSKQIIERDSTSNYIGWYTRITTLRSSFIGPGRGKETDTAGTCVLWADLDTYKTQFSKEAAIEAMINGSTSLPSPTMIVDSGHGLQVYWELDKFCEDPMIIKMYNRGIISALEKFGADNTADCARILRIPGTMNRKNASAPLPVTLLHYDRSAVYDLNSFPVTQLEETKWIAESELPLDFFEEVQEMCPELYNRMYSADTALLAGAPKGATTEVDRSQNDMWCLLKLLGLNVVGSTRIDTGVLFAVLKRSDMLIGSKTSQMGDDYAARTVVRAENYFAKIRRKDPQRFFASNKFVPAFLGEEVLYEQHFISSASKLWIYLDGVFKDNAQHALKKIVVEKLGVKWQRSYMMATMDWIQSMAQTDLVEEISLLTNVRNGMLSITGDDIHLFDHSPSYNSLAQFNVHFLPKSELKQELQDIKDFAMEILPSESAFKIFFQFCGTVLIPDYRFKKVLLLVGPGDCGKSTLLNVLAAMIGEENIAARTFQDLSGGNRFAKASLLGKLANIYADLPALEAKDVGPFKAITGNDIVDAEFKGQDAVVFRNFAKLVFSANSFPMVKLTDQAFFNRWIVIPCRNKFVREEDLERTKRFEPNCTVRVVDRQKAAKVISPKHLSAFLWYCIEGLQSLLRNEDFCNCEDARLAKGEFMAIADSVTGFFTTCTTDEDMQHKELKSDVYEAYCIWCQLLNVERLGVRQFNQRLLELRSTLGVYISRNSAVVKDGVRKTGDVIIGRKLKTTFVTSTGNTVQLSNGVGFDQSNFSTN